MYKLIRGYFKLERRGRVYDVGYLRTREPQERNLRGGRITSLHVVADGCTVMQFEDGHWVQEPETAVEIGVLDEIVARLK